MNDDRLVIDPRTIRLSPFLMRGPSPLEVRDARIARRVKEGATQQEVADELGLARSTVAMIVARSAWKEGPNVIPENA